MYRFVFFIRLTPNEGIGSAMDAYDDELCDDA